MALGPASASAGAGGLLQDKAAAPAQPHRAGDSGPLPGLLSAPPSDQDLCLPNWSVHTGPGDACDVQTLTRGS